MNKIIKYLANKDIFFMHCKLFIESDLIKSLK